jgi:tryptophan halogenase
MKITIVGAGTAGLINALILKRRFPDYGIRIIKSKDIGIIGVGESSTEHWKSFIDYMNFDRVEMFQRTDCTYKMGVYFKNWTPVDYLHHVSGYLNDISFGQFKPGYAYLINKFSNYEMARKCWLNNSLDNQSLPNQMHFNTFKLNEYLTDQARFNNIEIIEDLIQDVLVDDNGIKELKGEKETYTSDFYVDCTGFKRLLISKLGAKWLPYNKHFTLNHAIAFPTEDTQEYPPYTQSIALKNGWMWRIPVWGRWGNGYVFNDNFINADEAKKEVEDYLGHSIEIGKDIKFESGRLDKFWIKNCTAVGLSSSFFEPLEATAIATSIQQSFILMHNLHSYNKNTIDKYNNEMNNIHQNVCDFVFLSYMNKRNDTDFWRMCQTLNVPDTLKNNLELWKNRLPILSDFNGEYNIFYQSNFIIKLHGLNMIDKEVIKKQFESYDEKLKKEIQIQMELHLKQIENASVYKHKKLINKIRENKIPFGWSI